MGRHSAPDDDDAQDANVAVEASVLVEDDAARGRHSQHAVDAEPDTDTDIDDGTDTDAFELLPGAFEPAASESAASGAAPPAPPSVETPKPKSKSKSKSRTGAGDLVMLRRHSDVRARCIAAVVAPFVVYFAVMIAVGASGRQMALFLFAPLILAGVLVGTFLDQAHKKYGTPPLLELPAHWNPQVAWPGRDADQNGGGPSSGSPGPDDPGSTGSR